jgi:hypothetical protein
MFFSVTFSDKSEREMLKEKRHWQYTHFGSTLPGELLDSTDATDVRAVLFLPQCTDWWCIGSSI